MPVINILPPHVADMIAAGEVVERPASVIKELMENAIDAGARNIIVEIKGGGATYIKVSDDGCGMAPEDAGVAFTRHATSKLRDERGLEAISTMGFRGEALAAISAVSRIELKTRRREDESGCFVRLVAGEIEDMGLCACPTGTVMTVRDIFYNTPARLKFLKSDRSEASACESTALRCALGHPEISVRFIKDGRESFFSPGDNRVESCVYSLLGRDLAASFIPCKSEDETGMAVTGFISSPAAARGNRSCQYFYCNGRYIRSALIQSAVEQAYKNSILTGRYPACVLYLTLGHASVDVNVHPAKTEVKFSYERKVFDLIYQAVQLSLEAEKPTAAYVKRENSGYTAAAPAFTRPAAHAPVKSAPRADFYRQMSAQDFRENGYSVKAPAKAAPQPKAPGPAAAPASAYESAPASPILRAKAPMDEEPAAGSGSFQHFSEKLPKNDREIPGQARFELPVSPKTGGEDVKIRHSADFSMEQSGKTVENSVQNVENDLLPFRFIGEALKTYILVEQDDSLILIDKHAAHERMIFDRLKKQERQPMAQTLLSPATVNLSGEDAGVLEENLPLLTRLGFEIEPFGDRSFVVRTVPADMDSADAAAAIEEICEKLRSGRGPSPGEAGDEILHTVACKAAIKAGWNTESAELETLVKAVLSGDVKYCPHGRPVAVTMSRRELDKQFKRIV